MVRTPGISATTKARLRWGTPLSESPVGSCVAGLGFTVWDLSTGLQTDIKSKDQEGILPFAQGGLSVEASKVKVAGSWHRCAGFRPHVCSGFTGGGCGLAPGAANGHPTLSELE